MRCPGLFLLICVAIFEVVVSVNIDLATSTSPTYAVTGSSSALNSALSLSLSAEPSDVVVIQITTSGIDGVQAVPPIIIFQTYDWSTAHNVQIDTSQVDVANVAQNITVTATVLDSSTAASEYNGKSDSLKVMLYGNIVVTPSNAIPLFVANSSTAEVTVALSAPPTPSTELTTVSVVSSASNIATISPSSIVFSADNYSTPVTLTVTPVSTDSGSTDLVFSATGGSYDIYSGSALLTIRPTSLVPDLSQWTDNSLSLTGAAQNLVLKPYTSVASGASLNVTVTSTSGSQVAPPGTVSWDAGDGTAEKSVAIAPRFGVPDSGVVTITVVWTSTDPNFGSHNYSIDVKVGQPASVALNFDISTVNLGYRRIGGVQISGPPCPSSLVYASTYVSKGADLISITPQFLTFSPTEFNTPLNFTIQGLGVGQATIVTVLDSTDGSFAGLTASADVVVSSALKLQLSLAALIVAVLLLVVF